MKKITLMSLGFCTLLSACSDQGPPPTTLQSPMSEKAETDLKQTNSQALNQLFDDYNEASLALAPLWAMFQGRMEFNHEFGDLLSDDALLKAREHNQKYLNLAKAFADKALPEEDVLSLEIFIWARERDLAFDQSGATDIQVMLPMNQFRNLVNFYAQLATGTLAQPFKTVQDYENWLSRTQGYITYIDQAIMRMQQGIEQKVVLPKALTEKLLVQIENQISATAQESVFYQVVKNMPQEFSDADKKALTEKFTDLIAKQIMPAHQKLADFIKNDYLPNTRETHGLAGIPKGDVMYEQLIIENTTTKLSAEEIHQIGLSEVNRLFSEMEKVKNQVNFNGTMLEFFDLLKQAPQFYFESPEALVAEYERLRTVINPKLDKLFKKQPKTDYIIKEIEPFRAASSATAQYMPGAPDGSRPGIFYVNTYDLPARPNWYTEALSIHEASPGHHFQVSLNQEAGDLPAFRRFGGDTAYIEGWGLYSETLGLELGMYQDPYQYFGMLYFQMWRACRLVVDTGLHAKGWSREQAIAFMQGKGPFTETDVTAEVERYMAIPGQALAYMIGKRKIEEIRTNAEKALGEKFDIREFHYQILKDGSMPLDILERKIDRWVKAQQS